MRYNGAALRGSLREALRGRMGMWLATKNREESSYEGSRSILVSGQASRLGLGASDRLAGMGGSSGNSWGEYSRGGGSHAAARRGLPVLCHGDGLGHAADLLREG